MNTSPNKSLWIALLALSVIVAVLVALLLKPDSPGNESTLPPAPTRISPATPPIQSAALSNTICPVMPDMAARPDVHTDYEGRHIHFCCPECIPKFLEDPETYLANLPAPAGQEGTAASPEADS
jgi:YHS domain-containing protein